MNSEKASTLKWSVELRDFIQQHLNDDTAELLFAAKRYKDIDVAFAVEQIEARRRLKTKLPEWWENADLVMSGRVPAEQCSSELTARYKRRVIEGAESLCDMTGGMGVDFYYMSQGLKRAIYTERQEMLCLCAMHNFEALSNKTEASDDNACKLEVRHGDGREMAIPDVDVIYLDPARRATDGSRVYAIEDCEPNVIEWQDQLLAHAKMVVVKLSPMVDVTDALRKLKGVSDVHVVGVKNECKEVMVVMKPEPNDQVQIHCIDFLTGKTIEHHYDKNSNEGAANVVSADWLAQAATDQGWWLYEPDVTLMKAQGFKSLCDTYGTKQLDYDTRLMVADTRIDNFPGRVFQIEEWIPFSSKELKKLKSRLTQANIAVRNFPLSAEALKKKLGTKDGGELYLFGATVRGEKIIAIGKKAQPYC